MYPENETPNIFSTPATETWCPDVFASSETAVYTVSVTFPECQSLMNSTKEMLSDVLQTVMVAELEDKLGCEKSELTSDKAEKGCKNTAYDEEQRNGLLFLGVPLKFCST